MLKKTFLTLSLLFLLKTFFAQKDYVLKCDFNPDDVEWTAYNTEDAFTETKDGKYTINHKDPDGSWNQQREFFVNPKLDYEIILSARQIKGDSSQGFGLVFGRKDKDNYFVFDISSTGLYTVFKKEEGKKIRLVEWTKSSAIKPKSKVNILSLKHVSGKWTFFINGTQVHTMDAQKTFGFYYGFYLSGVSSVEFDYLYLKQKSKPINLIEKYDSFGEREHLGFKVNSIYTEKSPVISSDAKTLYFTRDDHPENTGDISKGDIWYSQFNESDSTWGLAKSAGSPWNTEKNNFIISISADNQNALLGNKYDETGKVVGRGISVSHKKNSGWSVPKSMTIKNNYNYSDYSESCLSPDGSVLLITSFRDDTYGDKDIYVCFLQADSSWSEPKNIGSVVNSFADEVGPFLAADGITMYFSSGGHPGYGSNDIFMTRRMDGTWTNWSEPKNLGPKINTVKWDAYYTVPASGKVAYLVSSTKGSKEDIYMVKQPVSARPVPLVLVSGVVYNSETKKTMAVDITYSELGSDKILGHATSDPVSGMFQLSLPQGKKYSFNAAQEGFVSVHYNYDATNLGAYKEEKIDMYLSPIKVGVSIVMNNLFFTANKYDILSESYPELDKLYNLLIDNPTVKIEIGGHTSINTSGDQFNQELSSNRAAAVKKYLLNKGIADNRITSKGYGYSKPIYQTNVEEVQAKNRRVEFTILSK